ncbi:50S ribosomal protein L29 [Mycoplasmoides pneumoniae]|uniref:50S ribosomal protein L29 n=1 Tax=Mycoplasmoides pneumoniae TaxID=2104 RepID=UPI000A2A36B3|nr:50S ribosomal protein L29 [Mycoplasmoides pneumoniae]ARQ37873.1 50S ribosomal protein L29 [Mycoplasmoides pneumoniae]
MTVAKELRQKSSEELVKLVIKLKGELLEYRFKLAHGELDKPHLINQTRRLLATILTILTERKLNWQEEQARYKLLTKKTNEAAVNAWKQHLEANKAKLLKSRAKREDASKK